MFFYRKSVQILGRIVHKSFISQQFLENQRKIHRWVAPTLQELQRRRDKIGEEPLKPRSTFLEWNYEAEIFAFGQRLGEEFDKNLLEQALTHRSYANLQENNDIATNQDLIKEGNSLILHYLNEELAKKYPKVIVMALVEYLTKEEMLAHIASHLGLKDIILTAEFPVSNETLANTLKSVVAALKNSQDTSRAHLFIKDFILTQLNGKELYDIWKIEKPLEQLATLFNETIEPRLCNQSASGTILANYQVGLYNNKKLLGIGWGESIEIAKETAALDAIQKIYNISNNY